MWNNAAPQSFYRESMRRTNRNVSFAPAQFPWVLSMFCPAKTPGDTNAIDWSESGTILVRCIKSGSKLPHSICSIQK
jgi:hypothetical protein